jgi:uncharacterized protein (UPF0332 family)
LVHAGLWTPSLGKDYSMLWDLRTRCDYGALARATEREATDAVAAAERILRAVSALDPETFPLALV